jgi:hypothetical protein
LWGEDAGRQVRGIRAPPIIAATRPVQSKARDKGA